MISSPVCGSFHFFFLDRYEEKIFIYDLRRSWKTKQTSVVIYYWTVPCLWRKRKNGMISTRTNFKLLNSMLENRSSELYNELHRPIRKGKIRGAISWKVKRGWKKGCGNYAYDLRNDSCVQRIQPSPLLPFFPTLLPLPLFFTAHVLIISSRSKPSLSRPKIHVS